MSKHDDRVSMQQMLDYARQAVAMARGRERPDLESDYMFQLALTRLAEIVGEAASRVSVPTRERYQEIPWPDIVGMRNRLTHGYDAVDLNILWDTVAIDLPELIAELEKIIEEK
ncbi:MAG: DUF86 domain-containing protein [Chloroflexota bacterium]